MVDKKEPDDEVRSGMGPHEQFLELCALSTTGGLTTEERNRLQEHLSVCSDCREAMKQFETVVDHTIPALAPELGAETPKEDPSFPQEAAEASFFQRLSEENDKSRSPVGDPEPWLSPLVVRRSRNFRQRFDRYHFWLPLAAGLLLCTSLGILTYRMGKHRGIDVARLEQRSAPPAEAISREALAVASQDRDAVNAQLAERDKAISELRRQIVRESSENAKLKASQSEQQLALQTTAEEKSLFAQARDRMAQQAAAGQEALQGSEKRLKSLERERADDVMLAASLEAKVAELSRALNDREQTTDEQQELLAKDRDIRELMGARDRTMSPLLPPGTFVQIDAKQTRVQKSSASKGTVQSPFARPIYFLDIRTGYACGWCEIRDGILTLIPHPDSGELTRSFRHPSEVEVVGRVIGIARNIEEERQALLEESLRRTNPPKK
jgi:hypothetical protein